MKMKNVKIKNMKNLDLSISILKNVKVLYFIFFISLLNVLWLLYYKNYRSIIIFASSCLVLYLINKNMIFVLGLSLIIVNIASLVKTTEGYKNKDEGFDEESDKTEKNDKSDKSDKINKSDKSEEKEGFDEDSDSDFMQDKTIMKKIKQLDPVIFDTIKNLNSVDIEKINKTINELTNKVKDP